MERLKQTILEQARRLGFALAGVTTPDPPANWKIYTEWLERGHHGGMAYLAEERAIRRRADPRLILPGCRSILALGIRYPDWRALPGEREAGLAGRVASYAWGRDYHEVLPERLAQLAAFIGEHAGRPISYKAYTDTGPILERELAQRAGLGWIGRNSCLIAPGYGSHLFLAELLLDLPLPPDPPFEADRCGTCTRCLAACPTGCIQPDRTLDARRCISYLTIENKGDIPSDLQPHVREWVFGCDTCQVVCPWNLSAAPGYDPAFSPAAEHAWPDLLAEISLTAQEFNQKFQSSPVLRARRRGYLRNVAVSLGNRGDRRAIPPLAGALVDDPLVARHARIAMEKIEAENE